MALPEPFLDVMLVKKLQIQLGSGTYVNTLPTTSILTAASVDHPVPGTCKWLNHVLKLLVCIFMFGRVVLVP